MTRPPFPIPHVGPDEDAAALRAVLQHDADRLAVLYWHGIYSLREARAELRSWAVLHDLMVGGLTYPPDSYAQAIADDLLQQAIPAFEEAYGEIIVEMADHVLAALRAGGGRLHAHAAATALAQMRKPTVSETMIRQAVEIAGTEFRQSEWFWCRRERERKAA